MHIRSCSLDGHALKILVLLKFILDDKKNPCDWILDPSKFILDDKTTPVLVAVHYVCLEQK